MACTSILLQRAKEPTPHFLQAQGFSAISSVTAFLTFAGPEEFLEQSWAAESRDHRQLSATHPDQ